MLLTVGPYTVVDPILLYKVLRIAKSALKIVSQPASKTRQLII